ncbi:MAG TPA: type II secretion system protein, partial [Methylomirabilota bacterium]|nr:type II secretion system protein [Methylomirabilota bacterium]
MTQRGVTLVELLIVVMLLATALVAVVASSPLPMQAVTAGGLRTAATLWAQQCLERARAIAAGRVPLDLEASCPAESAGYPGLRRTVTVTASSPTETTTTVAVRVDVPAIPGATV